MKLSFSKSFVVTADEGNPASEFPDGIDDNKFRRIVSEFGGKTFNNGLYRVLQIQQLDAVKVAIERVFPEYMGSVRPFAYDWLGRHFAVDLRSKEPSILLLEVGAGEAMIIPADIDTFHKSTLSAFTNSALASDFWEDWYNMHPTPLAFQDCVGYKIPLFLGGEDDIPNLEVTDLDVYLEICAQMREKIRGFPEGTKINSVSFE